MFLQDRLILICGASGAGKTSLTLGLQTLGASIIGDDVILVNFVSHQVISVPRLIDVEAIDKNCFAPLRESTTRDLVAKSQAVIRDGLTVSYHARPLFVAVDPSTNSRFQRIESSFPLLAQISREIFEDLTAQQSLRLSNAAEVIDASILYSCGRYDLAETAHDIISEVQRLNVEARL